MMPTHQDRLDRKKSDFIAALSKTAPVECEFQLGDVVTFTNQQGVVFEGFIIVGFDTDPDNMNGRFIYCDKEAYWFPLSPFEISK